MFETVIDDYAEVWVNGELPLVLGMPECKQQRDRHRFRGELLDPRGHARDLARGEGLDHSLRAHALAYTDDVGARHQRRRVIACQIVQRRAILTPQPQHILKAGRRHERHPRTAALEQGVGGDGGSMNQG